MYTIPGTSLIGVTKGTDGLWIKVLAPTANMTLDTTASTYAVGCEILNIASGRVTRNVGTTASPIWLNESGAVSVPLTAEQINGMYGTAVEIVPAVAGKAIIVDSFEFDITRTSTAFANGGAVQLQYASTNHAGGTAVGATIASTVVTGASGRTITARIPVVLSDVASASIVGVGLYLTNATGAFDTGTGTANVTVRYHLI